MATQNKRTTIYLDPDLHKALRLKAVAISRSVSELVNDAVRESLRKMPRILRHLRKGSKNL